MVKLNYKHELKPYAQKLRREMTKQEKHLWYDFLKTYPAQFRRQKQFSGFIVDFYCAEAMLVVELDGSQHYDEQGLAYDKERTDYLNSIGLTVIRFANNDVDRHFEGVCLAIDQAVKKALGLPL
ncbi:MAG: endonuclease domain-containing protein [Clostridia bacterium]|nr:endonuclease domain-containing protein [Clostridia bacterium]